MDLEIIMLSEISQTENIENHTHMQDIKLKAQMNKINKQKLTDTDNSLVFTRGKWGRAKVGEDKGSDIW